MNAKTFLLPLYLLPFLLTGCYENSFVDRSLIFSTHTTVGLEASVQPTEAATTPVSFVLGYKRTEAVLNPVYHNDGIETPDTEKTVSEDRDGNMRETVERNGRRPRYRQQAYSVIAKLEGNTGGKVSQSAEGQLSVAQWFATGEAATRIAGQPGITGAVSGNSAIAEAAALQAATAPPGTRAELLRDNVITHIYKGLKELAKTDSRAAMHVAKLDEFGRFVPDAVVRWKREPGATELTHETVLFLEDVAEVTFETWIEYRSVVGMSMRVLKDALQRASAPEDREYFTGRLSRYEETHKALELRAKESPAMADAIEYYCNSLTR